MPAIRGKEFRSAPRKSWAFRHRDPARSLVDDVQRQPGGRDQAARGGVNQLEFIAGRVKVAEHHEVILAGCVCACSTCSASAFLDLMPNLATPAPVASIMAAVPARIRPENASSTRHLYGSGARTQRHWRSRIRRATQPSRAWETQRRQLPRLRMRATSRSAFSFTGISPSRPAYSPNVPYR